MSEIELLERAKRNDHEALEKIFVENKTQIFSMIHNMVGDRMIAEDLTMETFEKAFKNINNFVPNYKIETWISKIGKNHAIDYLRRQSKRPTCRDIIIDITDNTNPEKDFISKEQVIIIEKIVNDLKGIYKEILMMWLDEKSYKEISTTLNIPMGTLAPYLRNIRKRIMKEKNKFELQTKQNK